MDVSLKMTGHKYNFDPLLSNLNTHFGKFMLRTASSHWTRALFIDRDYRSGPSILIPKMADFFQSGRYIRKLRAKSESISKVNGKLKVDNFLVKTGRSKFKMESQNFRLNGPSTLTRNRPSDIQRKIFLVTKQQQRVSKQ